MVVETNGVGPSLTFGQRYTEQAGEGGRHVVLQYLAASLCRQQQGGWLPDCPDVRHLSGCPAGEGGVLAVALLELEKTRHRLSSKRATECDLWQFKRHSSLGEADWQLLIYVYETAFGSAIKGLRS